jgi:murein L,D-transpeptidase YcbB/YkuD
MLREATVARLLTALLLLGAATHAGAESPPARSPPSPEFTQAAGERIPNHPVLQAYYALPGAAPQWSEEASAQLLAAIRQAEGDGLDPAHYWIATLQAAAEQRLQATAQELDRLRTAAFVRLAVHLYHGVLEPDDHVPGIDLVRLEPGETEIRAMRDAVAGARVNAFLDRLRPRVALYDRLREALGQHRLIAAQGGWGVVPEGPTLHPGERSARVPRLRERLRVSGDLRDTAVPVDVETLDEPLTAALRHFQERHLLDADGVLGKRTLEALNVPVEARIDQIRVNLERARWLLRDLPARYVLVDVPGYELRLMEDGKELLRSRTVVGKPYRKTPIFRSAITYLDFSPTWTVPPTILRNDVLPAIRKDAAYLQKRGMRVLKFDGTAVDPATVDWQRYSGRTGFPYLIRQDPGPENALGKVKFMFPNPHHVYLHDTPSRELFARAERAFSSGCIRVEQAAGLATLLLGREGWSAAEVEVALAAGKTRRVKLNTPVPVLLYYWTVRLEDDGDVAFKRDIYGRDAALLAALEPSH